MIWGVYSSYVIQRNHKFVERYQNFILGITINLNSALQKRSVNIFVLIPESVSIGIEFVIIFLLYFLL